jgi:hypothetical protein
VCSAGPSIVTRGVKGGAADATTGTEPSYAVRGGGQDTAASRGAHRRTCRGICWWCNLRFNLRLTVRYAGLLAVVGMIGTAGSGALLLIVTVFVHTSSVPCHPGLNGCRGGVSVTVVALVASWRRVCGCALLQTAASESCRRPNHLTEREAGPADTARSAGTVPEDYVRHRAWDDRRSEVLRGSATLATSLRSCLKQAVTDR